MKERNNLAKKNFLENFAQENGFKDKPVELENTFEDQIASMCVACIDRDTCPIELIDKKMKVAGEWCKVATVIKVDSEGKLFRVKGTRKGAREGKFSISYVSHVNIFAEGVKTYSGEVVEIINRVREAGELPEKAIIGYENLAIKGVLDVNKM